MKYLLFLLILPVLACETPSSGAGDVDPGYLAESERFTFYNPFWLNLHHYLHHEVLHRDSAQVDVFAKEVLDLLSAQEKEVAGKIVEFYQMKLVEQDLRTSDYMAAFKHWSAQQNATELTNVPDSFQRHCDYLTAFAPIYRQHIWPEHQTANQAILDKNLPLIRQLESRISEQLEQWTQTDWQTEKIRVDITYYAKSYRGYSRDRPFTTLGPTHVIMNTTGHETAGNWIELLFHEASHHLITPNNGMVSETLKRVAKELNRPVPRSLWHAYLFYFSGKACQEAFQANGLPDYEVYMVRNRVFRNYLPYLEKYLPDYMAEKTTLTEASKMIITSYLGDQ